MKIAILTQPLGYNYGGILQNYALQQTLKNLQHESVTLEINYRQHISILKLIIELPKRCITKFLLKKRKHIFSEFSNNRYGYKIRKKLRPFINKFLNHLFVNDYSDINLLHYHAFIVGSDQVWRPLYNLDKLDKMYLSFIPQTTSIKRIAYAASFGVGVWEYNEDQTSKCSKLIQQFDAVSTREIDGIKLCEKYLNRNDVESVLDPTLLLDNENYIGLCNDIPKCQEKVLFAYILDVNSDTMTKLEDIAYANELKVKLISADENCTLSMEEWLAMFRDAKLVITDSYHGTVFSIIFCREFYTIANQSRGGSRFTSLLSQLELTERMFDSISDITMKENIDWLNINIKLNLLKEKSLNFLKTNLS